MSGKGMRTELGRVRGLGAARDGVHHWWVQRLTAIALVPLALWLVASLAGIAGAGHAEAAAWIASPPVAIALVLTVAASFWHAALGLQVVIEDYIHHEGWKLLWIVAAKFACVALATAAVFSVLKLAL